MCSILPDHRLTPQRHQRPANPSGRGFCFVDLATSTIIEAGGSAGRTGKGYGGLEGKECEGDPEVVRAGCTGTKRVLDRVGGEGYGGGEEGQEGRGSDGERGGGGTGLRGVIPVFDEREG